MSYGGIISMDATREEKASVSPEQAGFSGAPGSGPKLSARVWCSQRMDLRCRWRWAVTNDDTHETIEFGAEYTKGVAERVSADAVASWKTILTHHQ